MRIKSSVLLGLILVICAISGFSLLKRLTQEVDEWRPSNLYSSTNVSRRSTFSVVSSAPASYSEAVASVSSGSGSMFRHRGASLYAPASGFAYSQSPMAGTASYSQSPIAYSQRLHTTSSAEFRSFGGGGNADAVSMSGGSIKSSGFSSTAHASVLSVSMPSTSVLAYNNTNADYLSSVSGDIAMASTQAYAGIGNTTGGMNRISGRKNSAPTLGDPWWVWFDSWLSQDSDGNGVPDNGSPYGSNGNYTFDRYTLEQAYNDFINSGIWNTGMSETPSFDEWLDWYLQAMSENGYYTHTNGHTYSWLPIGDIWPLVVMALLYSGYMIFRRRKQKMAINN